MVVPEYGVPPPPELTIAPAPGAAIASVTAAAVAIFIAVLSRMFPPFRGSFSDGHEATRRPTCTHPYIGRGRCPILDPERAISGSSAPTRRGDVSAIGAICAGVNRQGDDSAWLGACTYSHLVDTAEHRSANVVRESGLDAVAGTRHPRLDDKASEIGSQHARRSFNFAACSARTTISKEWRPAKR